MKTISVVIPVYNGENYIESCIEELSRQNISNFEIIFVDDGSTDRTAEILRSVREKFDNVIIYAQDNAGAGMARNLGMSKATGEYIAFLDVDDKYANDNVLKMLYEKAKENKALICGGSFIIESDKKNQQDNKYIFDKEGYINFEDYQFDYGFMRYIYSRKLIEDNKIIFPQFKVYEDPVFLARAMIAAEKFYAVPDNVYKYSGSHQKGLNLEKTIDYLSGLTINLELSANKNLGKLHKYNFERLINTGCYYAEKNWHIGDKNLFYALLQANKAVQVELLKKEGINLSKQYVIPTLNIIWNASCKYQRIRKKIFFWKKVH